ncbi:MULTISPECIES: class Ib ribonucleoside-diphosphate reductase assembly flavoprotein NrdI [Chromohalobacter]|uniref:Protein NrdI n=1 Tax=Chromohalobacter israelensis (strain ATCC BAA-138 / DSM 3043 / CIP 106854 / NCIMB 13768 / 1H11) TaxID=290398 RepID=NRDI_CHRI1|nr:MULTISPECIES: class Ib ribonucleoside-diphosphate reductase assembly flavoprotein NrdI [Chromohalobacter]Q1R0L8.1 RecName: Full=Protein NrdI [Chromohalobacter salexigens DSM 3043]ABE57740.1 nrdI protein [Chromohalobacter salexigens DSM 3043]MBZ5876187.1 class Ib ribonucleoside-diphosphate reductase assembly flavoprotein NrdI [Chromohalobacter salexigens]MDF9434869.1 class Ib ribonucleoside-diphosphate reductase assembly flavoprotein NrdI [Chromohalobacter israelensis]MDO0945139.1 class Ib r
MCDVVYFSTQSGNTRRFVEKLDVPAQRIPRSRNDAPLRVTRPYVLILPTYGDGDPRTAVPGPVIRFLNDPRNRALIQGVVAGGNTNFGAAFGLAGRVVAHKCEVPLLHRFELMGTPEDVAKVRACLAMEMTDVG